MRKTLSKVLALILVLSMVMAPMALRADDAAVETVKSDIYGGEIELVMAPVGDQEVSYDVYHGVAGKDYTDPEVYTMVDYLASTTSMNWSPCNWETADDDTVGALLITGLYGFEFNSDLTGWAVMPEMATEPAEDVTAEYVGQYGIVEGETHKAYKFKLNEAACWEDGTPINADTFIYSYKELLDPLMLNRRADSVYAGSFSIYNAKNYFYAGKSAFTTLADLGLVTVADAVEAGYEEASVVINCWDFWGAEGYTDADGNECPKYVSVLDETVYGEAVEDPFSGASLLADYGAYLEGDYADYIGIEVAGEVVSWEDVGILKTGEYEIVMILTAPLDQPNYYVPYNMSSTYLVYEPLWEACKTYFDADGNTVEAGSENVASITTNYGTSVDTTASYGPYKLTYFELDKNIKLERNENWYGYSDGKHEGMYQTDIYEIKIIADHETQLLSFLNGEIDSVGLQSEDMATYGSSDYITYTPQSYTTKLSWNTDPEKLAERGNLVLTSLKFRQAWSLAIDRTTFAQSMTSAGSAGYGMLNYLYVYDPFTGATYRDTDAAKAALCDIYGLTYGDDGDYDDLDEAYDAITGYDLGTAQALMAQAYDELTAAGLYNDEEVTIEMRVYQSDDIYVKMFNFLQDALKAACVGTGFEGKVGMAMVADADYYDTMYSGNADMIFTTWGGAAYSPYTMLYECYCDDSFGGGNQMEYGFETDKINVTMTLNGTDYTESLRDWAMWCDGALLNLEDLGNFTAYDAATQSSIYAVLEYAYLANYVTTPIYYRNVGSLHSQKINYAVSSYTDLLGFGGLSSVTYNYTDAEWAAVASTLTY